MCEVYMNVILLNFLNFLKSVPSFLSTDYLNSLYESKVSNVQTRETQINFFALPIEYCSVSLTFVSYRGAKLINCRVETGLSTVDFPIRIKCKTLKHMQIEIVNYQFLIKLLNEVAQCILLL